MPFSQNKSVMIEGSHEHAFIFNDDGFEVCTLCGVCTTLREQQYHTAYDNQPLRRSIYADVLINHNLGYVELVEKEYKRLKTLLCRGYSNKALYAYCTYNVLLNDRVYYSINQISKMFQIDNFSKLFCQIENNRKVESQYFDVRDEKYVESSLHLFLSYHDQKCFLDRALEFSRIVRKKHKPLKLNFLTSVSLYFTLKNIFECSLLLQQELSTYFSINIRTFKSLVSEVARSLETP